MFVIITAGGTLVHGAAARTAWSVHRGTVALVASEHSPMQRWLLKTMVTRLVTLWVYDPEVFFGVVVGYNRDWKAMAEN